MRRGIAQITGQVPAVPGPGPQIAKPKEEHVVYISPNGNDVTGNGNILKPFATYAKASSVAVAGGASLADLWAVQALPGTYTENIDLVPFVGLVCFPMIAIFNGTLKYSDNWSSADVLVSFLQGVTIGGNVDLDGQAVGFTGFGGVTFIEVFFNADISFSYKGNGSDSVTFFGGLLNSDMTIIDAFAEVNNLDHYGMVIMTAPKFASAYNGYGGATEGFDVDATAGNSIAVYCNGVGNAQAGGVFGAPGFLSLKGALASFVATCEAIPPTVTLDAGAPPPVTLTSANAIGYVADTGNWVSPVPTTMQSAIDRIAANTLNVHPIP
jgi:hypothetical protein